MTDYKLVPVEPTLDMLCQGMDVYGSEDCAEADVLGIYKAMIAATPQPAEQQPAPDVVEIGPNDLLVQLWSSRARSQWDYSWDRGVKITHVPSGITVTCETEGSVYANKEKALRVLEARLKGWSSPDVAQLVDALVACARASSAAEVGLIVDDALAPYRKGGGE